MQDSDRLPVHRDVVDNHRELPTVRRRFEQRYSPREFAGQIERAVEHLERRFGIGDHMTGHVDIDRAAVPEFLIRAAGIGGEARAQALVAVNECFHERGQLIDGHVSAGDERAQVVIGTCRVHLPVEPQCLLLRRELQS